MENRKQPGINRAVFWISFIFMLLGVALFGYLDKAAAATATIVAGSMGMAFANIDKIERFKAAGFEARMRKAVEEAYATTNSVKSLAYVMARSVSDILAVEDRYAGIGRVQKLNVKKKIDDILTELGIKNADIKEASRIFDAYLAFDHVQKIKVLITKDSEISDEIKAKADALARFSKTPYRVEPYSASPQEIARFVREHGINSTEIKDAIADYEHFVRNYEFRRPEHWD